MDDPYPSIASGLTVAVAVMLYAFTSHARVAFRFLSPVTLESLVERAGRERTRFLRKSLRAPTAFYFSLHLTSVAASVLLLVAVLAAGWRVPLPGGESYAIAPGHGPAHDALLVALMFLLLTTAGYLVPALLARLLGLERLAFMERSLPVLRLTHWCLAPLTALLASWAGEDVNGTEEELQDEELDAYIGVGTREGILEEDEGELLRNVVEFGDTRVREVMTPRTDVIGIPATASVQGVAEVMAQSRYSRIPVHDGQLDDIVGIVSLKDVIAVLQQGAGSDPVTKHMKPAYIVPESKRVSELLRDLQARRLQIAVVIDEYGGTAGVATVEDLLEEIVGEIREEHEDADEDVREVPEGGWLVLGSASVFDLAEVLDVELEVEDSSSVAGLLLSLFDRVPAPGESVEHLGFRFEVREADPKRVRLVHVQRVQEATGEPALPRAGGGAS